MKISRIPISLLSLLPSLTFWMTTLSRAEQEKDLEADIVVYGDAAVGVSAAIQGTRMKKSVILVSQYGHLGGMTSSGLGWTDLGSSAILGGISREFYHQVYLHYAKEESWTRQKKESFQKGGQGGIPTFDSKTRLASVFEPKVAEMIFDRMVKEAGVKVVRGRLDSGDGAVMTGARLSQIRLEGGRKVRGKMFIDATYEGDLMAAAKVTFTVGREANAKYEESSNSITLPVHGNNLMNGVSPFLKNGDAESGLLPRVNSFDEGDVGKGDHRLQAFCYRMCLTNDPANRVKIEKPENYQENDYEILFRTIELGKKRSGFFKYSPVPNLKTDSNNTGGISTDFIGGNYSELSPGHPDYWDWTTLSHQKREEVAARHRDWQLGLIWTLQNHERVPEATRKRHLEWGLAGDEFVENAHWPYNIYVREGRRMVSDFVMTEHQCRQNSKFPQVKDSVGMGAYTMDSHNVQRVIFRGHLKNEGDIQKSLGGKPYPISYRSITPAEGECENLLVPWCLSASHIAFGSIRMEPVGMVLGQSAATAASQALDDGVSVQKVDYGKLKKQLLADGQALYQEE